MTLLKESSPELLLGRKVLPRQCGCARTNVCFLHYFYGGAGQLCITLSFRAHYIWFWFYEILDAFVATNSVM